MHAARAVVVGVVLLVAGALHAPGAVASTPIAGEFQAKVDFSTVRLKDVPAGNCLLTVNGVLTFTGSLIGAATGTTNALETAPCSAVAVNPPGTFFDVFQFRGQFVGTVDGRPVKLALTYSGVTQVGGHIDAIIVLRDSGISPLRASATVAVGGTYTG